MVVLHRDPVHLLALLAVVWIADSAAYFAGRRFGRHKLAPSVSPGKTWEGVGGALPRPCYLCAAFWTSVCGRTRHHAIRAASTRWCCAWRSWAFMGDLFESWMKRQAGVKDSGHAASGARRRPRPDRRADGGRPARALALDSRSIDRPMSPVQNASPSSDRPAASASTRSTWSRATRTDSGSSR